MVEFSSRTVLSQTLAVLPQTSPSEILIKRLDVCQAMLRPLKSESALCLTIQNPADLNTANKRRASAVPASQGGSRQVRVELPTSEQWIVRQRQSIANDPLGNGSETRHPI